MTYRTRNIGLAVMLGVAALLLVMLYVKKSGSDSTTSQSGAKLVSVFVASHDIAAGTPGTEMSGALHVTQVPTDYVVAGAISSKDQIKGLVSTAPILSGQQVTKRQFQRVVNEGVTGEISRTQRAFQLSGDSNQLMVDTLKAGDRVDVVASVKYTPADFHSSANTDQGSDVASRIVLRNLLVLQDPQTPAGSSTFGGGGAYMILIRVTDSQVQKLFYAIKNSDWSLVLRPAHAAADSPGSAETTGTVLGDGLRGAQYDELVNGAQGPQG
jgi:Flp pilus assembly protein CpaB